MPRRRLEVPPAAARNFVQYVLAFFAEPSPVKRDEIASRQMHALREYQGPREKPVRIPDVKERFPTNAGSPAVTKVWVYINTAAEVGDEDHLKVFATEEAANAWFAEHDPEGVAFEHSVMK